MANPLERIESLVPVSITRIAPLRNDRTIPFKTHIVAGEWPSKKEMRPREFPGCCDLTVASLAANFALPRGSQYG